MRADGVLRRCAAPLRSASASRFFTAVADGSLTEQQYADYLAIEEDFVAVATRLHGLATWDAPDAASSTRNARAVAALVTEQADYFAQAKDSFGVAPRPDAVSRAAILTEFALEAGRSGGWAAVVTVMLAAESLYLRWCTQATASHALGPGLVRDWVELHVSPSFASGVDALAAQVDRIGEGAVGDAALDAWFLGMLEAEVAFHDSVFEPTTR